MKKTIEVYPRFTKEDVDKVTKNFYDFVNNFNYYEWVKKQPDIEERTSINNEFFKKSADIAFKDFLEYLNNCWGMEEQTFKKDYVKTKKIATYLDHGKAMKMERGGEGQQILYRNTVAYYIAFKVNKIKRIYPMWAIEIVDVNTIRNVPIVGTVFRPMWHSINLMPGEGPSPQKIIKKEIEK